MKNKEEIKFRIAFKRYLNDLKRRKLKRVKRRDEHLNYLKIKEELGNNLSFENQIESWLPTNLKFLLENENTKFTKEINNSKPFENKLVLKVPNNFNLIENPTESYTFIRKLTLNIILDKFKTIEIDYSNCSKIDLSAQIYLDVILGDVLKFHEKRNSTEQTKTNLKKISGKNIKNEDVKKLLFSVGSPAVLTDNHQKFNDILPYPLCIHNKENSNLENAKRKEVDSTELVEYVINSLDMLGKKLTDDKIEDLSTVIGEILINAEEHSTMKYRYSTGYFQKYDIDNETYGLFHLVIMNFGETIYEKFKSPTCTNYDITSRMKELSHNYTSKKWFSKSFEEETLWTLYALQEGITSVSVDRYKRGNGSIRFIESFFNIKGVNGNSDQVSKMSIISGNTNITFDGEYGIRQKNIDEDEFKVMTFNDSGNIEDKPDEKYVKFGKEYFPGTLICAKILITKNDLE